MGRAPRNSQISQLVFRFREAAEALGLSPADAQVERWSVMIHRSMNLGRRRFHTAAHVLEVTAPGLPPLATLAGLFHDLVYLQVDDGYPMLVRDQLSALAEPIDEARWRLTPAAGEGLAGLVSEVFGKGPGDELGLFDGLNEYLSACVALAQLEGELSEVQLVAVAAAIEATIPFRALDAEGRSPLDLLDARLTALIERRSLPIDDDAREQIVQEAQQLGNRDVLNFADPNPGRFLTNTWALLPETNRSLTGFSVYSIVDYRHSLARMNGFLRFLQPETIFARRAGQPDADAYEALLAAASRNLRIARRYLDIKLCTIGLIEAFALLTGGDAPIALFMGDVAPPADDEPILRAEDQLPAIQPDPDLTYDPVVLDLLENGRSGESHFDLRNSPLSSYLYRTLGEEHMLEMLGTAEQMFRDEVSPSDVIGTLPQQAVHDFATAFARLAPTRARALEKLIQQG